MGSTALKGLAVLHHRLDGVSVEGTGEALGLALHTLENRDAHVVLGEVGVDLQHLLSLGLGLFLRGVGCVAFLPEEL